MSYHVETDGRKRVYYLTNEKAPCRKHWSLGQTFDCGLDWCRHYSRGNTEVDIEVPLLGQCRINDERGLEFEERNRYSPSKLRWDFRCVKYSHRPFPMCMYTCYTPIVFGHAPWSTTARQSHIPSFGSITNGRGGRGSRQDSITTRVATRLYRIHGSLVVAEAPARVILSRAGIWIGSMVAGGGRCRRRCG